MSLFRLTCRLFKIQNNQLKTSPKLIKQQEVIFSLSTTRFVATKSNFINIQNNILSQQYKHCCNQENLLRKYYSTKKNMEGQDLISHEITKNITLISPKRLNINLEDKKTLKLSEGIDSPLAIIIPWLFAKKSHLLKYSKIYTDQGFNVLTVQITPWELLWPAKGAKLVAQDALNFLENNTQFSPLIVHGFSVAGYLWGEILLLIINDLSRYQPLLDKFYAQIWDSITGVPEIPIGVPPSVFPNNKILQNGFRNYIIFHLKIFHDVATVHYIKSQDLFHNTVLKVPALFLVSKSDLIGSYATNISTKEDMDLNGIKTTWKCWEKSPHVGHFMKHPEEYLSYVHKHLKDSNVLEKIAEKIKSKL